jgi:hypothetical protein
MRIPRPEFADAMLSAGASEKSDTNSTELLSFFVGVVQSTSLSSLERFYKRESMWQITGRRKTIH